MCANVSCVVRAASMMSQCATLCSAPRMPPRLSHRIGGMAGASISFHSTAQQQQHRVTQHQPARVVARTGYNHHLQRQPVMARAYFFPGGGPVRSYTQAASTLTREQLHDLVYRLNEDERELLMNTLKQFESNKVKAKFEVGLVNALPFIGFGFLDNFTMIIAGDYIEHTLGLFMCISTMAAAALGNTISDVIGIGSAFYVEKLAEMSGVKPPKMSPIQLEMKASRRAANLGRVLGITIGCLLGMCPLLFMKEDKEKEKDKDKNKPSEASATDAAAAAAAAAADGVANIVAVK
ncbi:transmembrane protein 65-like isoform X3 [Anopheles merus]|uniref:transmembrane protein 65-like isoform X3 n=1 Tax=Anopheles merus TaxID=30066 RepID=UPI001BE3F143|nr:transmembrane protein 65-like isoform X3 [Anopheles merus]